MASEILILGGSRDQLPMIAAVQRRGFRAVVMDMSRECPGFQQADEFIEKSISDAAAVTGVARDHTVSAIVSMITEAGVMAQWCACEALGLPSMYSAASAQATHSKRAMRDLLQEQGFPNIPYQEVKDYQSLCSFFEENGSDIVLKQSDTGGQKGLARIRSLEQLERAWHQIGTGQAIVAERFIAGSEINAVYTVLDGQLQELLISDRITQEGAFGVVRDHCYPSGFDEQVQQEVARLCSMLNTILGIRDAVVFPQFMIDEHDGTPWLLELGVRVPGGIMDRLFYYVTGIDLVEFSLDLALGSPLEYERYRTGPRREVTRVAFINGPPGPLAEGMVSEIRVPPAADREKGLLEHGLFRQQGPGLKLEKLSNGGARFYYCITTGSSSAEARSRAENFYTALDFIDKSGLSLKRASKLYETVVKPVRNRETM